MTKLVNLFFLFLISSPETMLQMDENKFSSYEAECYVETSIDITKPILLNKRDDKSIKISSAARKSTIINATIEKRTTSHHKSKTIKENAKSSVQARRPSSDSRPVNINIPPIPIPRLTKPHKMNIPNRRNFLPVGKS